MAYVGENGETGRFIGVALDGTLVAVSTGREPLLHGLYIPGPTTLPDLRDTMTCLGVIAVIQHAWCAPYSYPEPVESFDADGVTSGVSWRVRVPGRTFEGDAELDAMLAALEAAPQ